MSDTALPDSTPPLGVSDAPPSVGRSSPPPAALEQPQTAISDELKERLDRIVYSEVSFYEVEFGDRARGTLC